MKDSVINSEQGSTSIIPELCAWALAFLFTYTAVSKVYDWQETRFSLYNQWFPPWMAEVLLYGLPILELVVSGILLTSKFRKIGFVISALLLSAFTGYIIWILLGFANRIPCSCGGVISSLSWSQHLLFNLLFLAIAGLGWWKSKPTIKS